MEYTSKSAKETQKIAQQLVATLKGGEVIGLIGDLGAGKTTFTQGLAKALGIKQNITSPTFVLMKVYSVKHPSITQLCHIDAYRLTSKEDLIAIGALDYIDDKKTITVIEWADKVDKILPNKTRKIFFNQENNIRHIRYK
jgi:tRNA threonylcarbamoyladenosine biosynthesis protein TsaE